MRIPAWPAHKVRACQEQESFRRTLSARDLKDLRQPPCPASHLKDEETEAKEGQAWQTVFRALYTQGCLLLNILISALQARDQSLRRVHVWLKMSTVQEEPARSDILMWT